jgi:hypothetical protein
MSMPNLKIPMLNYRKMYFSKYRDCSLERQRIIIQEDFEAVNEMHQLLLSPEFKNKDVSLRCRTSVSELSSLGSDFSRMLNDDVTQED